MADRKRPEGTRTPNGAGTIYLGNDGRWHGRVTVGLKDDGRPDRRHVNSKSESVVRKKVQELERERDDGKVRKTGQNWTVELWLKHWLGNVVAPPILTENAFSAYEVACRVHLIPGLGAHRLRKLEAEDLEKLYRKMIREGAKPGRVHQVHRTIRAALNERRPLVHGPTRPGSQRYASAASPGSRRYPGGSDQGVDGSAVDKADVASRVPVLWRLRRAAGTPVASHMTRTARILGQSHRVKSCGRMLRAIGAVAGESRTRSAPTPKAWRSGGECWRTVAKNGGRSWCTTWPSSHSGCATGVPTRR
jgi:hypothetical protein